VPSPFGTPSNPISQTLPDLGKGVVGDVTYNFNRFLGLSLDYGKSWGPDKLTNEGALSLGPRFMWRGEGIDMFLHTMISWNRLSGPNNLGSDNGIGAVLGGGMDLPVFRRFSIRLFEADYVWGRHNYADLVSPAFPDLRRVSLDGARIASGIVWNFGFPPTTTPTAACSVQPSDVMVGEPITATATTTNFNPKHTLTYTWTGNGGKVTGKDNTASIDTNGMTGGSYTVSVNVSDPKIKKNGSATCNASFTVKEPPKNPPTMSCSADPSNLQAGGTSNITCTCTSPDNVPVTVSNWNASGGSVSGNGASAALNTAGASAGTITVSATCTDSRGLNTQASTQVTVQNPPPPAPPQASKLSDCDFANMAKIKKPWRVDNECKGKLDDVAKNLQQNADNKLVIVGNAEPGETRPNLAAERAVDAKAYLTSGEAKLGIDPSRIETRTGSAGTMTDEFWIVPAGGTFSERGTQPVDESKVMAVPDHPHAAAKPKAKVPPKH
jgi:outer membrane protein OmpA-like peptidoglycan-associated protein